MTHKIKFGAYTDTEVDFALRDIQETLDLWRDWDNAYTRKLWSEWDYLTGLKLKRRIA